MRLENLWLLGLLTTTCCLKVDDSIHYIVKFDNVEQSDTEKLVEDNEKVPTEGDVIHIKSRNNEDFVCRLPSIAIEAEPVAIEGGPSPADLLAPLFKNKVCSFKFEAYWSYELCHGRYVLQFHEEKTFRRVRMEYYLGNYHKDYLTMGSVGIDLHQPPKRRVDDEDLPYFPVFYSHGTNCELTEKPRTTYVHYVCRPKAQNIIHSIYEVSTCSYEVVVLTDLLCSHPTFRPKAKTNFDIMCYNQEEKENPKPIALQELQQRHDDTFKREYSIVQYHIDDDDIDEEIHAAVQQYLEQMPAHLLGDDKKSVSPDTLANNKRVVQDTINRLFLGQECIHGGQGWWLYEFCQGNRVTQYHVEENGDKISILLGTFDQNIHRAWVDSNPKKNGPQKTANGQVTEVRHMYTKGDICHENNHHRNVEVRFVCVTNTQSPLAITMTLTETVLCQYKLVIESERLCEPLQYSDEYGLVRINQMPTMPVSDIPPV